MGRLKIFTHHLLISFLFASPRLCVRTGRPLPRNPPKNPNNLAAAFLSASATTDLIANNPIDLIDKHKGFFNYQISLLLTQTDLVKHELATSQFQNPFHHMIRNFLAVFLMLIVFAIQITCARHFIPGFYKGTASEIGILFGLILPPIGYTIAILQSSIGKLANDWLGRYIVALFSAFVAAGIHLVCLFVLMLAPLGNLR